MININKEYIKDQSGVSDLKYINVGSADIPIIIKKNNKKIIEKLERQLRYYLIKKEINKECRVSIANYSYNDMCNNINDIIDEYNFDMCFKEYNFDKYIEIKNLNQLNNLNKDEYWNGAIISYKPFENLPVFYLLPKKIEKNYSIVKNIKDSLNNNLKTIQKFNSSENLKYIRVIQNLKVNCENNKYTEEEVKALWYKISNPIMFRIESKDIVEKDLWEDTKLSILYHENSKLRSFHQQGDFMKPVDEIDDIVKKFTLKSRKVFEEKIKITLPEPTKKCEVTVETAILRRRSRRNYNDEKVNLQTLSNILFYSYGITGRLKNTSLNLRAVPSGGGLYPIDLYLAIRNVENLDVGIYYYDPFEHCLIMINNKDMSNLSNEVSGYSMMLDKAAFTVLLSANFWRNQWKYHERGYRVILLDCGHLAQNIHIMATAYNLGSCCLMGFVDDEIDKILEIDGVTEHSMYLITVGNNEIN